MTNEMDGDILWKGSVVIGLSWLVMSWVMSWAFSFHHMCINGEGSPWVYLYILIFLWSL